jgi:hypothetical protein
MDVTSPEYPDLVLPIRVNPTVNKLLAMIGAVDDEELGQLLAEAFNFAVVEAYGVTFDFSTPEAAAATLTNPDLPADLRFWIRNAPIEVVEWVREDTAKKFRASPKASTSGKS